MAGKKPDAKKAGGKDGKKMDKTKMIMKKVTSGGGSKKNKKKWSKGKARDKLENTAFVDQVTLDKMYKEVPKMTIATPAILSDKYKLKVSVSRRVLRQIAAKKLTRVVEKSANTLICTRMDKIDQKTVTA